MASRMYTSDQDVVKGDAIPRSPECVPAELEIRRHARAGHLRKTMCSWAGVFVAGL